MFRIMIIWLYEACTCMYVRMQKQIEFSKKGKQRREASLTHINLSHQLIWYSLLFTLLGSTYYLSTPTKKDRDEWILYIKQALECHFANPEILPFKPSKILLNRPQVLLNVHCPRSRNVLTSSLIFCRSCGRRFSSGEYVNEHSTMLQLGMEEN